MANDGATGSGATKGDFTKHMQLAIISQRIDKLEDKYEQQRNQLKLGEDSKVATEFNILKKAYDDLINDLKPN